MNFRYLNEFTKNSLNIFLEGLILKKTEKLIILISIVLVSLLVIGAVSAADTDETAIGEKSVTEQPVTVEHTTEPSIKTEHTTEQPVTAEHTTKQPLTDTPDDPGTFEQLNKEINEDTGPGETLTLNRNYTRVTGDENNPIISWNTSPFYLCWRTCSPLIG